MPRDLGQRAQEFREKWLARSGGWFSELTITIADTTGVWDVIVIAAIFVCAWIIIRSSPMEISLVLALAFDLSIPLQYYNDEYLSAKHEKHLERYWPLLITGCVAEGIAYFLIHPDLFTLIVCIKTTVLTALWMGKDQDGLPIKVESSSTSAAPSGKQPPTVPSNMPECKHIPEAYKYLKRKGFSDPAIAGMILSMSKLDKEKAKKNFRAWIKEEEPKETKRREKQYAKLAQEAGWPGKWESGSGGGGSEGKGNKRAIPKEALEAANKLLKSTDDIPPEERREFMTFLKGAKSEEEIKVAEEMLAQLGIRLKKPAFSKKVLDEARHRLNKKKMRSSERHGYWDHLNNAQSKVEIQEAVDILRDLGMKHKGPLDLEEYKFGESDGEGGVRDILLSEDFRDRLIQSMRKPQCKDHEGKKIRPLTPEQVGTYRYYLKRPFSRREFEREVIPWAKDFNVSLGPGHFGGGPHRFDVEELEALIPAIQQNADVDAEMASHMIFTAINLAKKEEAKKMLDKWSTKGVTSEELKNLRKTLPQWY
nr:hypothetical protein L203_03277 [Cryptococcus depauperatus CBS 7841]